MYVVVLLSYIIYNVGNCFITVIFVYVFLMLLDMYGISYFSYNSLLLVIFNRHYYVCVIDLYFSRVLHFSSYFYFILYFFICYLYFIYRFERLITTYSCYMLPLLYGRCYFICILHVTFAI